LIKTESVQRLLRGHFLLQQGSIFDPLESFLNQQFLVLLRVLCELLFKIYWKLELQGAKHTKFLNLEIMRCEKMR